MAEGVEEIEEWRKTGEQETLKQLSHKIPEAAKLIKRPVWICIIYHA